MNVDPSAFNRRAFLNRSAGCVGGLALASLLAREQAGSARAAHASGSAARHPLPGDAARVAIAPGQPEPKAKAVICLFQFGGPSQMDLFDPKPELTRLNGQPHPGKLDVHFVSQAGNLLASPFKFSPNGHSGIELSEAIPYTAGIADEITLIRSMHTFTVDHEAGLRLIHNGKNQLGRPSCGAWLSYALGAETENLPAYVVLADPGGLPIDGVRNWSSGFLPAEHQGTPFRAGPSPVLNVRTPEGVGQAARRGQLEFLDRLNGLHRERYPENTELSARIANFEMAARMQTAVPEVLDFADESEETRKLYGLDRPETEEYGRRCLLARRLVERGVRYVEIILSGQPWDTHKNNARQLQNVAGGIDQPSAALVRDLKRRGLLDSTVVWWTGEFGRLPISQGPDGRDHNGQGFSCWLAGGGFRPGYVHGATDEFGYKAVDDVVSVHDLHATLLYSLGLDHQRLTYPNDGRDDSLTDVVVSGAKPELRLLG
ncbi:MAG: DUF1501 domain-containing protein [Pirellulales bacterium]|nr:DUF1501 domain-containing protein [Pirellulales bacterium]